MKRPFLLLLVLLTFTICHLPSNIASAATCVSSAVPEVSVGGLTSGTPEAALLKDSQALVLGASGTAGWAVLDYDCFMDHAGADVDVYELGMSEGGEVYVGTASAEFPIAPSASGKPQGRGWTRIPESAPPHYAGRDCSRSEYGCTAEEAAVVYVPFACDGHETLPKADKACVSGDQWFGLDIGEADNTAYKYVYIWSDGGADVDAVTIKAPLYQVDLTASVGGTHNAQFLQQVTPTSQVSYSVRASGDAAGEDVTYALYCDDNDNVPISGTLVSGMAQDLVCQYSMAGVYTAHVSVTGSAGTVEDMLRVDVGTSDSQTQGSAESQTQGLLITVITAAVLAALVLWAHARGLHKRI